MGVRGEIKQLAADLTKSKNKDVAENTMQLELIMIFIENISNAQNEVYKFVSDISEKTIEELKDLDVFMESIQEIFKDETFKGFFKLALK
jgi:hypothetical protein